MHAGQGGQPGASRWPGQFLRMKGLFKNYRKSSSTRERESQIHNQKRRMSEFSPLAADGESDCEFGFPSHEWSCSNFIRFLQTETKLEKGSGIVAIVCLEQPRSASFSSLAIFLRNGRRYGSY